MKRRLFPPQPKGIKKWVGSIKRELEERKRELNVEGIENIKVDTQERVYLNYKLIPLIRPSGLYRVEELLMSEKSYNRKKFADLMKTDTETEKFLSQKPINYYNTSRMYIIANYNAIKQLRNETDIRNRRRGCKTI